MRGCGPDSRYPPQASLACPSPGTSCHPGGDDRLERGISTLTLGRHKIQAAVRAATRRTPVTPIEDPTLNKNLAAQRDYIARMQQAEFDFSLMVADAFVRGIRDI